MKYTFYSDGTKIDNLMLKRKINNVLDRTMIVTFTTTIYIVSACNWQLCVSRINIPQVRHPNNNLITTGMCFILFINRYGTATMPN